MVHADSLDGYLGHLKGTSHAFHIYIYSTGVALRDSKNKVFNSVTLSGAPSGFCHILHLPIWTKWLGVCQKLVRVISVYAATLEKKKPETVLIVIRPRLYWYMLRQKLSNVVRMIQSVPAAGDSIKSLLPQRVYFHLIIYFGDTDSFHRSIVYITQNEEMQNKQITYFFKKSVLHLLITL